MSDIVERMKNYIPGEASHEEATPEVLELAIAEIERLRLALKPFAKAFENAVSEGFKYHNVTCGAAADQLFYQDFERAALALSPAQENTP